MPPGPSAAIPISLTTFIRLRFYEQGIMFDTQSSQGKPIYHTNVMMSIGGDLCRGLPGLHCLGVGSQAGAGKS